MARALGSTEASDPQAPAVVRRTEPQTPPAILLQWRPAGDGGDFWKERHEENGKHQLATWKMATLV